MNRIAPLVFLLFALPALASVLPVAPLEPRFGENPYDDVRPRAAGDAASMLVVWEQDFSFYQEAFSIHGAFVDPRVETRGSHLRSWLSRSDSRAVDGSS